MFFFSNVCVKLAPFYFSLPETIRNSMFPEQTVTFLDSLASF